MRDHPRLILGALAGCLVAVIAVTFLGGCQSTADPLDPAKKVTPQQLTQETIDRQHKFDDQATQLQAQRQTILDQYQSDADALKNKYQQSASKLAADTAAYNTAVASFNQKLTAAANDLAAQEARNEKIMQVTGGLVQAAGTGAFGPLGTLGTALFGTVTAGLVGAWRDNVNNVAALKVKNQQIQQLITTSPAAPQPGQNTTDTGTGALPLVQGSAPAGVVKLAA